MPLAPDCFASAVNSAFPCAFLNLVHQAEGQQRQPLLGITVPHSQVSSEFDVSTDNMGLHLKNMFADGVLEHKSVTEDSSVTAADGKNYLTKLYNLAPTWPAGYRVRSPRDPA
jgi:hypothetical protein